MAEVWVLGASAFFACENRKKIKMLLSLAVWYFVMEKLFLEGWNHNTK